jgi:hypothetical protein
VKGVECKCSVDAAVAVSAVVAAGSGMAVAGTVAAGLSAVAADLCKFVAPVENGRHAFHKVLIVRKRI